MNKIITAAVLTHNDEDKIRKCLKSLLWCDEILVIDDFSVDGTADVIGKMNDGRIKISRRKLDGDFSQQRNFAIGKAAGEWVLFIDSDEIISEELKQEIKENIAKEEFDGFVFKRDDYFQGRWLKHGETVSVKLVRLGRKGIGKWRGKVHEVWDIGKTGEMKNAIQHFPHPTIKEFLAEINKYSSDVAQSWIEEGRLIGYRDIFIYPLGKFLDNYFIKLGILDGMPGLILAFMMSFHSFLARGKAYLRQAKAQ